MAWPSSPLEGSTCKDRLTGWLAGWLSGFLKDFLEGIALELLDGLLVGCPKMHKNLVPKRLRNRLAYIKEI